MSTIITNPYKPTPELKSEEGVRLYLSKISKLSRHDLYTELSNVMAAKHNQMMQPVGLNEIEEKQAIITDLSDKVTVICVHQFGQAVVFGAFGGDLRKLNEWILILDKQVARLVDEPEQYGAMLLEKLGAILQPE